MDKMYTELKDNVQNALKPLAKKDNISPAEIEAAKNAVSLIKKIDEMCEKEEWNKEGYSQRHMGGNSYKDDPYRRWEIMSYRDGTNMDSSMGYPYYPSPMYNHEGSYRDSSDYSRHSIKDRSIDALERLMDKAGSDYERQKIKEYIRKLEMVE